MRKRYFISLIILLQAFLSCQKEKQQSGAARLDFNEIFDESMSDWIGDFADYPVGEETKYKLSITHEKLPAPLDTNKKGIRVSGNNHSDDLFMFLKKKVSGLKPQSSYKMDLEITFASGVPAKRAGVGGPPAEAVIVKAGLMSTEPARTAESDGRMYRMNIDKGNQGTGGKDMQPIGNIANGIDKEEYRLVKRNGSFTGVTNSKGEAWICIGTDSGFEATTTLYYTKISGTIYQ
ncbi:hypothetical protein [Pedobacter sp. SYP-B3415]|uniref:hypothetical protein n=1 Tax=Pedobacter sp. SYP-B3415 TaxID=2496641 RepID=UPI00101D957C|nr:hypothetical protein [Pedobacter sp. SYP-B3415]